MVSTVPVPARTRVTVDPKTITGMATAEFSTKVESDQPLIVDRTLSWDVAHGYGAHAETAVAAPALTWYLAEGATHSGFNLFYLLQNPNAAEAQVRVRFLRPSGAPLEKTYTLPPTSRNNIWVNEEDFPGLGKALAATDVSAVFECTNDQPIIVERALYLDLPGQMFGAGHESAGVTAPAMQWFLAEGNTGPYFDLFVLIANPGNADAQVEATYLLPDGTVIVKPQTVAANSRFNIWVDGEDRAPGRHGGVDDDPIHERRAGDRRAGAVVAGRLRPVVRGAQLAGRDVHGDALGAGRGRGRRHARRGDVHPAGEHVVRARQGQGDVAVRGRDQRGEGRSTSPAAAASTWTRARSSRRHSTSASAPSSSRWARRPRRSSSSARCTGMRSGSTGRRAPTRSRRSCSNGWGAAGRRRTAIRDASPHLNAQTALTRNVRLLQPHRQRVHARCPVNSVRARVNRSLHHDMRGRGGQRIRSRGRTAVLDAHAEVRTDCDVVPRIQGQLVCSRH